MPRKKSPEAEVVEPAFDRDAHAADANALTALTARDQAVDATYGDGLPYDRNRVIGEARWYMAQSAEAMLEAGRRLILLKEHEPHGEFVGIVENQLQLSKRTAQVMMQAAAKYLAPAIAAKAQAPALLSLGRTKLLELITEPDEDIAALADGGTLAGLTIDEIDAMSSRELRAALRKERAKHAKDVAAKDRVISGKEDKVSQLEEQLARRSMPTGADAEQQQIELIRVDVLELEPLLQRLAADAEQVLAQPATTAAEIAARQAIEYVAQRLADLINQHGLSVDLQELVTPSWMAGGAQG